jgi:hypothetical protein
MKKVNVYLKSGRVVEFNASEFELTNYMDGQRNISWKCEDTKYYPDFIDPYSIEAVFLEESINSFSDFKKQLLNGKVIVSQYEDNEETKALFEYNNQSDKIKFTVQGESTEVDWDDLEIIYDNELVKNDLFVKKEADLQESTK